MYPKSQDNKDFETPGWQTVESVWVVSVTSGNGATPSSCLIAPLIPPGLAITSAIHLTDSI